MNFKLSIPLAIIIAGLVIAGAVFFVGNSPKKEITTTDLEADETLSPTDETSSPENVSVETEGWSALGDPNAPVTIIEYSDFACPFCARFWKETLPLLKENYIETGDVYFVYKDFVVVGGDRAAEAAYCAGEQDSYWAYHDLLFERQAEDRGQWLNSQVHEGYAQELGLDADALSECFQERRYQEKITLSTREAAANGGTGTPFFLINGQPVSGAQPYTVFQNIIDGLLQ